MGRSRGGNKTKLRTNVTVMAEAVLPGYGKIYFAFWILVANEIQLSSFIFLLHVVN